VDKFKRLLQKKRRCSLQLELQQLLDPLFDALTIDRNPWTSATKAFL